MENLSSKAPYRTNPHYGPSAKSVYDDVFGGPPRFGVPSLSPRTGDYAEIFGGFRASRCASSIPALDLPAAEVAEVPASLLGSHFDYSEVFGTSDGLDFVVFEELVERAKGGSYVSSDEAWTPARSETMSDESEPFACLDGYQSLSNTEFHLPNDGIKQFKVSYNKAFHTSEDDVVNGVDHVTQLNNIPGYSFLVTEAPPLQKMVVTNNLKHEDFSGGLGEGKRLRKTTSCPNKPFVTVSDISLRTRPSHLPPPSRPPPVLSLKDGNCNSRSSKLKASRSFAFGETTSDDDSPLYYDVEVDASLSAAATKGVMEKAQAELESAKHVKDTSKQAKNCGETSERDFGGVKGVPDNATKLGEKYGLLQESSYENLGNVEWKQNEEFYEVVETDDSRKLFDMGDDQRFVVQNLRDNEHGREKRGSRAISHQEEVNRKMTSDSQIHEKIIVEAFEGADFENMAKVWKKENEEERYQDDFVMEEHGIRLRENEKEVYDKRLKEAMETAKIEKRLKETFEREERKKKDRGAWEREEKEKREIEASEKELEEKRLREEKEENEKRLRLASEEEEKKQMEAWEREEIEKSENEARERELEEKRLREAIEKQESENRLRLALEEKEKKQREAREIEEKEKREKEVRERGEKEKREKEARERGEKEKREKEAREREVEERRLWEKEKREKEAREREVEERRLRKALEEKVKIQKEREEKEKQEKEAQERELEEKRLREATEQEEKENKLKMALKKEENEKKRNLACERDEAEKRLKDDLRSQIIEEPNFSLRRGENKEKFNEGSELEEDTQVQEVNEREDNEKRLKEAFEHEEIDKLWEEDNGLHESGLFCGPAIKGDKNSGEPKKSKGSQAGDFSSSGVARDGLQHKKSEIGMGGAKESLHMHDTVFEFDKKQSKKAANFAKLNVVDCDSGTRDTNPRKVQVGKDKKEEKFMPSKEVKEKVQSRNAERKGKNLDGVLTREEREREERLHREKELENERLRKIEEEREREREREKDRMAVDMASLERAAVERAKADAGQRVPAEARERLEKSNAEARLRAERAAVERATAEARERAFQKAKAGNATVETRERVERMRQSSSRSESCQAVGSTNGSMKAYSLVHGGVEVESAQRCKARLERHQRTAQRAAKALEEKNMRDLLAQRELAERNRLAEGLDAEVKRWSSGKEGNLRALLSTLQYILGPDSGWQPIPLTEVITSAAVKRAYRKATLCVHPDKLQQRGASVHQKYICEKVFDLLKAAWNNFNSEER